MWPSWKEAPGMPDDWQGRARPETVMLLFIEPCLPTISRMVPTGPADDALEHAFGL
jgi:hypothetical protein